MINNRAQYLAAILVGLVIGELLLLSTFVSLDVVVYDWIKYQRGCALNRVLSSEWSLITLVTFVLLLLGYLCCQRRWAEALHGTAIVMVGGFLIELLKTVFERARPSVISPLLVGNSFPSGHTAGAILLVGVMSFWLIRQPFSRATKVIGVTVLCSLAGIVMSQRLYLARHWISDIIGTVPLAAAWLCVTLSRPVGWHGARPLRVAGCVLLLAYPLFYFFPELRISLPSAFSAVPTPFLSVSLGDPDSRSFLQGAWGDQGQEEIGPITWMHRGEASVNVQLQNHHGYSMRFAARPFLEGEGFACFPLEVSVNQHPVHRLVLYKGWREYELALDPAWIMPGLNTVTFRTGTEFPVASVGQKAVAFHRMSLFAEKP